MSWDEKTRRLLTWFFCLSLAGLLDSIWLFVLHVSSDPSGLCTMTGAIGCGVIALKEYSEWFGVPVPVVSALFYATLSSISGIARFGKSASLSWIPYMLTGAWVALASTLWMAYVSFFLVRQLCPFCAVLYAISIALAFVAWKLKSRPELQNVTGLFSQLRIHVTRPLFWAVFVVWATAVAGAHFGLQKKGSLGADAAVIESQQFRSKGSLQAPVVITEFSDFECPHCRIAAEVLSQVEWELEGRVRVVYKFFPLDRSCNSGGGSHVHACQAARAAYCASVQKKFWPYHDRILAHQSDLSDSFFYRSADELGLDRMLFDTCMRVRESEEAVARDIAEGNELGLTGTPSIFINGRKYSGPITVEEIKRAAGGS